MLKLYTAPRCPKCKMLKTALDMAGLEYEETDDCQKLIDMHVYSAPVLQISETKYLMFESAMKYIQDLQKVKGESV